MSGGVRAGLRLRHSHQNGHARAVTPVMSIPICHLELLSHSSLGPSLCGSVVSSFFISFSDSRRTYIISRSWCMTKISEGYWRWRRVVSSGAVVPRARQRGGASCPSDGRTRREFLRLSPAPLSGPGGERGSDAWRTWMISWW